MINYPTSLDTLTNPTATDPQNNPSHSEQHANANDAIEALEAKVGITGVGFNPASSSESAKVVLHEDTDNGTNKITVTAPSSIASDKIITLPDATDTLVGKDTTDTLTNKTIVSPVIQNYDGWQEANETWIYASATTFTVSGDQTTKYQKGTKIKLTNASTKYFYVIASSYSSPNTTVTVTGEADLASGAITSPQHSYADCPRGFKPKSSYSAYFYRSFSRSIPSGTRTIVDLNGVRYDGGSVILGGSGGYQVRMTGFYSVKGQIMFPNYPPKEVFATIYINSSETVWGSFAEGNSRSSVVSATLKLNKGDYIYLYAKHNQGTSQALQISPAGNFLTVDFIGV